MLNRKNILLRNLVLAALPVVCLGLAQRAYGYVDLAPTLTKVAGDSATIGVYEVTEFDQVKHLVTMKLVRSIKGPGAAVLTHQVASATSTVVSMPIRQWAEPGAHAVVFTSATQQLVCMGLSWYQMSFVTPLNQAGSWKIGKERPDLALSYCGNTTRLADGLVRLLAGKAAIMTVEAYGGDDAGTSFDLAYNRTNLPGLARLNRVRMTPNMGAAMMAASSSPGYVLGAGPVDEDDLPGLIEKLGSPDATARAEAADDLGWLGKKAKSAAPALTGLLKDEQPRARMAAAAALLRINPATPAAVEVLAAGLDGSDKTVQRIAAKAVGLAGPGGQPLVEKLAALLKDPDDATKAAALVSLTTLGPASVKAVKALEPLLEDPVWQCDAADALGRIGPAAQPVPEAMVKMLSSHLIAAQWAAVRGMSQIGGKEAYPAVTYMINKLTDGATEVEGYNSYLYLSMLGDVAIDALPTLQNTRIKNPILPTSTQWAIQCGDSLPWLNGGGRMGGFGGPGGVDISRVIYQAYVINLGERLKPATKLLAKKIMDGTAGAVPDWGYEILACAPADAIKILSPHLADGDAVMRERAVVGLGYMGTAAAAAKGQLTAALAKATDEKEKHLMEWAIREVGRED